MRDQLRNARQRPGDHIWDMIEQELDAQRTPKGGVIGRSGIAVSIALLLMCSTSLFLFMKPDGLPASRSARISVHGFDLQGRVMPGPHGLRDHASGVTDASQRVRQAADDAGTEPASADSDQFPVTALRTSSNATEAIRSAVRDEPAGTVVSSGRDIQRSSSASSAYEAAASASIRKAEAAIPDHTPVGDRLMLPDRTALNTERLHRVIEAADWQPAQRILVPELRPGLYAGQMTAALQGIYISVRRQTELPEPHLAALSVERLEVSAYPDEEWTDAEWQVIELNGEDDFRDPGTETSLTDRELSEDALAMAERTTVERSEQIETAETNWVEEAMAELETWKAERDAEEAEDELKGLIEEAAIDEEDPLTKRQNETMDLYRSSNINRGFHIGVVTGYQNTWVSRAVRNPEVDRDFIEYRYNPGFQAGLNMGYDITDHFGLMMEFKYSDEGASYYNPLRRKHQRLDLRYIEIPLYAKFKHSRMSDRMRPMMFNYFAGFTFRDLRSITAYNDGMELRFGQDYNTSEWGISAGFDFDLYINRNFFWSVGVRGGLSGHTDAFPRFKSADGGAMTFGGGLFTRFSYRLPGK